MTDEIAIVDRVQVDIEDLDKFDHHAAIPASEPLHAVYVNSAHSRRVRTVYGFTAHGHPLVLNHDGSRLVDPWSDPRPGEKFVGVQDADPPLSGPFTPAPA